ADGPTLRHPAGSERQRQTDRDREEGNEQDGVAEPAVRLAVGRRMREPERRDDAHRTDDCRGAREPPSHSAPTRTRSSTQSASKPCRQVIFLPSARVRERYVIGISNGLMPRLSSFAVSSGSAPKPSSVMRSSRYSGSGSILKQVDRSVM